MSQYPQQSRPWSLEYGQAADRTVFNFFNAVYAWMAVGWTLAHSPLIQFVYGAGMGGFLLIALVAFGIAMFVQTQAAKLNTGVATGLFLLYSAIMGALYSFIFLVYPVTTLTAAFLLTAG